MKINQYGFPVVASQASKSDSRRGAGARGPETSATIQLSEEARQMGLAQNRLSGLQDLRADKLQEARQALLDGTLESESALDAALDRLIPDLI